MLRIGLTGGIGAGKSTASRRLAELGAVVIDFDQLSRLAVAPGSPGLVQVVQTFGDQVLQSDGALNRAALAEIVFADAQARARLETIIHPQLRVLAAQIEAEAVSDSPEAVVVYDHPLLVETGQTAVVDQVVVVTAPEELRVDRLMRSRGMSRAQAQARMAAQSSDEMRLAAAHVVLDGSGTDEHLRAQVDQLWAQLPAASS